MSLSDHWASKLRETVNKLWVYVLASSFCILSNIADTVNKHKTTRVGFYKSPLLQKHTLTNPAPHPVDGVCTQWVSILNMYYYRDWLSKNVFGIFVYYTHNLKTLFTNKWHRRMTLCWADTPTRSISTDLF